MKRNDAINKLLFVINKTELAQVIQNYTAKQPRNYTLQLLNATFNSATIPNDSNNWFTALAVLCIYQRHFAGKVLDSAAIASGQRPLSGIQKRELIDAIASGAKLTKADAG